jgi:type I restriction enzyme S subunit
VVCVSIVGTGVTPLEKKQEYYTNGSICHKLEATLTDNLDKAELLRRSTLKRAFEKKLLS